MAEIIDILIPKFSECSYFTVDTNVSNVPVTSVGGKLGVYGLGEHQTVFHSKDNIRLLSAGFFIPENFSLADWGTRADNVPMSNTLKLDVIVSNAAIGSLPGYGCSTNGHFVLPFANYEHVLDSYSDITSFLNFPPSANGEFEINGILNCNPISMIGVPAALDGVTIKVMPFIKIMHNLPLTAVPTPPPPPSFNFFAFGFQS